ncbi:MAG: RNA 2',3'-cyclic phosphodiesterase [Oscillospiraceae bacterium]|nr:RNA 2',3'-cyclic phosphodiesterase [Oscillospiraceae bacterium]
MRLFIAIQFDPHFKTALTAAQDSLHRGGYRGNFTDVRNLHLTLAFIGEYSDPDRVLDAMEQVQFAPFPIRLSGYIGNFNDLLWAGTEPSPKLDKLVKQLRHALAAEQIPFDRKKFNPHITLLRKAQISRENLFRFSDVKVDQAELTVRCISLMRSDFGKHGAVYTEIRAISGHGL